MLYTVFNKIIIFSLFFSMLLFKVNVFAEVKTEEIMSSEAAQFEVWKQDFKKIALQKGIDSAFLDKILMQLSYLPNVVSADKKQSEFLLTFWDYTDRVISENRVKTGKEMMRQHQKLIIETSEKYGVQPEFLVAFWGLETNYGTYKGEINTLNALATLAFDKRRRAFFTNELITLLKIIEKGEQTEFKGSWAGAFGNFQFMPTTYAAYAVDADGDGNRNIISSLPDAFASAANYLSKMGWNNNQTWGTEVKITRRLNWQKINANKTLPVSDWVNMGLVRADGQPWKKGILSIPAHLVLPEGVDGPAFLVYRNFDLIMRWNNSTLYALSVGILADKIKYQNAPIYAPKKKVKISRNDIKEIQSFLKNKGIYSSEIDGIFGRGTRKAIQNYQKSIGWDEDGYPSYRLLMQMRKGTKNK